MHSMKPLLSALAVLALSACPKTGTTPPPADTDGGANECASESVTVGTPLRLLTRIEYDNTVRDLLGDTTRPASTNFPREPLSNGLDNNAALLVVSADGAQAYVSAAEALSTDVVTNRKSLVVPCSGTDSACANLFIDGFGLKAYRRPLTVEERTDLQVLFNTAQASNDFDTAVKWTLQSVLQSPQFLYRDETPQAPVPTAIVTLSGYELATRLSYFLWATTPDDTLLAAAQNGGLDTPEGLTAQATRMLADPRANDGIMRVLSLWLYLDGVQTTEKNTAVYPNFSHDLAAAWRRSLELFMADSLTKDGTLKGLLTSNVLFSNNLMNPYGVTAPSADFVRTELPGTQRRGLLAQPGFLAFKSLPDSSSPVRRGVFVLNQLMCQPPPPPPAGVPIVPPAPSVSLTTRARFDNHVKDPGCNGCHQFIDPPGFVFEHYDGMGVWRDTENGQTIDATGGIISARDQSLVVPVDGLPALEDVLVGSRQVHDCMASQFQRFALGRELTAADACTSQKIGDAFMKSGGNFKQLMLAIVQTDAFRRNANPEMTP